ncbi:MAG: 30S ribosomal protein S3 [Candidatus Firestonebacteria bacterium]
MGQKVHPNALRIGIIRGWESRWFTEKSYKDSLLEDFLIRKFINKKWEHAGIAKIEIERTVGKVLVIVHTAKPGIIIGKKGTEVDELKKEIQKMTKIDVFISILEVRNPAIDAQLVAQGITVQLEKRISHKRAMKKSVIAALAAGAQGIKIMCSGRLGGNDIARREWYREGRVPLHTFRADIDFGFAEAICTYGKIGVKVWVFKGEILDKPAVEIKEGGKDSKETAKEAAGEHKAAAELKERR